MKNDIKRTQGLCWSSRFRKNSQKYIACRQIPNGQWERMKNYNNNDHDDVDDNFIGTLRVLISLK